MAKLPTPKFNLRKASAENETLISLVFRFDGKRLVYSTGLSIHPKDWDLKTQRPIPQKDRTELLIIKRKLDQLAVHCMDVFIESNYGATSLKEFRTILDTKIGKTVSPQSSKTASKRQKKRLSFFEFIDVEIQEMKDTGMKRNSYKVFERHTNILKEFGKDTFRKKKRFDYEDVDWNFRLKLIDWLVEREVQLAYGNKTLQVLRQFLERARRKKLHSNTDYQGVGWSVTQKKAKGQIITLTVQELDFLAQMDITGHLAKVRDICLIGAGTGQRFSDFSKYTPDNFYRTINNVPILSLISTKTDTPAKIPLNIFPWLLSVLQRNEYATPKISMQKFNDGLKLLCKKAEFDERILKIEQYMGRKARIEKSYVAKYEEVSSHICRRSFATNLYRMGYSLAQIMPMTGHATESQLRQYIGIDSEMNAEEIALAIIEKRNDRIKSLSTLKVVNQ
ncbi:MAG: hypothetical protein Sapg2KO_25020 [Saprospiraceae bacterium]